MSSHKLTVREILGVSIALGRLNGYNRVIGDGKTEKQAYAWVPFVFDSSTRWNIAKAIKLLSPLVEIYQDDHNKLLKSLSPLHGNIREETSEVQAQFNEQTRGMQKVENEVAGLLLLKKNSLLNDPPAQGTEPNPIDGETLSLLMPLISET